MKEPVITLTLEEYEELRKEHECLEKEHAELQRKYEASLQEYSRQVEEISACTAVIADLRWKLADLTRRLWGKSSEKRHLPEDAGQLSICFESPSDVNDPVAEEQKTAGKSVTSENGYNRFRKSFTKKITPHARKPIDPSLPREEIIIPMPEGLSLEGATKLGEEVSEQYAVSPARFYVKRIIRPKYRLADGRFLPTEKQNEYANNAAILNAFRTILERSDSQHRKQSKRCIGKTEFWRKAAQALPRIADTFPHSLPENPRRLQEKYNQYQREGYSVLITGKYGTRNAAKVKNDVQESLIIRLIADPRNLDNSQIASIYNLLAEAQGWDTITPAAIAVWRNKYDLVTAGGRLGETRFRNQKSMQVKRSRPTLPLLYWTMDGWTAELLYQKTETRNGRTTTTYTNRLTIVIVLDPCLNYPVGYAIGERETPELIKAALRNAANHTSELFGRRYRVNQLQSDNYGRGNLTPIYQVMGAVPSPR